jgi:Prolyl oligopeptidase family
MLYAFGGFGLSEAPQFRPEVIAFLERGGVYATANVRGGGEYGHTWHAAGMFEKKQNVFDDFIAAAEYLVREKYASPQTLGIMGGSNGGLLVGAVMEQRPDLFAVALLGVAALDMLRFHRFTGGVVGTAEYGSADNATECAYLYKYSPLHNVTPGACYPATLITTADHDDRVVPSHSFQFAATLQAARGCDKPVLIRIETLASHAYRPTDKRIAELGDGWAFCARKYESSPARHCGPPRRSLRTVCRRLRWSTHAARQLCNISGCWQTAVGPKIAALVRGRGRRVRSGQQNRGRSRPGLAPTGAAAHETVRFFPRSCSTGCCRARSSAEPFSSDSTPAQRGTPSTR